MTTATLEYRVYGLPIESKSYDLNDDGTLTIIGVASTTNKDYANEIVSPEVLESLAEQAVGINIYRDHNRYYDGGIGAVIDAWIDDNQLWIKGVILSEFAPGIKERLDIGMNFGFSISGFPKKQRTPEGLLIVAYDLKDITLTYIPMNWDTYGTVEYKSQNLITSNCLTGACYHALHDGENMSEDKNKTEPIEEPVLDEKDMNEDAGLSDAQLKQVKDMMNELAAEIEPRIVDRLKPEIESISKDIASETAEEMTARLIAEFKATQTVQEEVQDTEDKDLNAEDNEEEVVETETETEANENPEEDVKSEAGIKEPENSGLECKDEAEIKEDDSDVDESEPESEPESDDEKLDEKSLDEKLDEKIHNEIVKQLNKKSSSSKFDKFQTEMKKEKATPTVKPKRDSFGRNLNYI